jgi:hypothetical protein
MAKKRTKKSVREPVMDRMLKVFKESDKTLDELGCAMGYPPETARMSSWQFLWRTADPHFSMVRRFCRALRISMETLVAEKTARK